MLIVSSYAPPIIGGPQMMYNLFRDFPRDKYVLLTSYYNIDNASAKSGNWLPGQYIFYDNPKGSVAARQKTDEGSKESTVSRKIRRLKFLMKEVLIIRELMGFFVIFSQLFAIILVGLRTISRHKIEVLMGFSDYGPAMLGTFFLHKLTGKPYYIFLFDLYKGNFYPFPGGTLANIFEKIILAGATKIIVNNTGTKKFYDQRYGNALSPKMEIIHNSVFEENYQNLGGSAPKGPPYTVLFTGGVNWPQLGAVKNLVKAVEEIKDIDVIFKIYTPSPRAFLEKMGIKETEKIKISFASPKEMPKIQNEAHVLFLPLAWNTKSDAIIHTATPGKLTDYLIAGRPILVHAPSGSALVEYARENNFASIADQNDPKLLAQKLKDLLRDTTYGDTLVVNARATFHKNHMAEKNLESLKSVLRAHA